jgi:transcriptional regulator with XRE-family HTH domain
MPDIQAQIRRMREVLGVLVRASGLTLTPIERQIGVSRGYVKRLLQGKSHLKLDHLLAILAVLKVDPREFSDRAFPPVAEPSKLLSNFKDIVLPAAPPPQAATTRPTSPARLWTTDEIQEIVLRTLEKLADPRDPARPPPPVKLAWSGCLFTERQGQSTWTACFERTDKTP